MATVKVIDKDRGWREFARSVLESGQLTARVGFVGEKAQETTERGLTMAELGMIHEFGTRDGHVPERSFLRATLDKNGRKYLDLFGKLIALRIGRRGFSLADTLEKVALRAENDVFNYIVHDRIPPPNAPSTIARKGKDHPLFDTGQMARAVSHEVVEGDGDER